MQNQYFPLVAAVVMLALGLTLTIDDFKRAAALRKPLAVALVCQAVLLPTLCWLVAQAFHLDPPLAVGLMLMSAAPGGTMANLLSHLVNGDLALNLTLTAVNAVLSLITLPTILAVSMNWFLGHGRFVELGPEKFLEVFGLVLIPTAIGIAIRNRFPRLAERLQRPVRVAAVVLLVAAILGAIASGQAALFHNVGALIGASITFCVVSLGVGYLVPRWSRLGPRQAIAVSLEIGLHNGALAMAIAMSPQLLNSPAMATAPAIYSSLAPLLALAFVFLVRRLDPAHRVAGSEPDAAVTESHAA